MFKKTFILIGLIASFAILLTATGCAINEDLSDGQTDIASPQDGQSSENQLLTIKKDDHVFGDPDALITLIEYSDFECPYCQRFHVTAELLVNEFDGKVNWVYRHFPLSFHDPAATREAIATECADDIGGNDAFWEYAELIYERTSGNGIGLDSNELVALAEEMELDKDEFEECLDSNKYQDRVKQDLKEGRQLGVKGTPATFIVNNKTGESEFFSGAQPFEKLKGLIEQML
jgi:protein-disulfide isomerase